MVANTLTLLLQEKERGSFAVQADWTDYLSAGQPTAPASELFISPEVLSTLYDLVKKSCK